MSSILDIINPEHYLGGEKYKMMWVQLFNTSLSGILSYILFWLFLVSAVVVWFRSRNIRLTIILMGIATFIIFGDGLLSFFRFLI